MLRGSSGMNALKFEALRLFPRPVVWPPPGVRPYLKMLARWYVFVACVIAEISFVLVANNGVDKSNGSTLILCPLVQRIA
eukprot:226536-Heterocapsa_arctica.AAC.1